MNDFNLGKHIIGELDKRRLPKARLTGIAGKHYKTVWAKLENDRLKAYDLLRIAKELNLDLNKLKELV